MFDQERDEPNNDFIKRIVKAYSYNMGMPYPYNDDTKTVTLREAREMAAFYNELGYERDIIEELFGNNDVDVEFTAEWVINPLEKLTEILDSESIDNAVIYSSPILQKIEEFGTVLVDNDLYVAILANDQDKYLSDNRRRQIIDTLNRPLYRVNTYQLVEAIDLNGDVVKELVHRIYNFGTRNNPINVVSKDKLTFTELSKIAYNTFKWEESHLIPRIGYLVFEPVEIPEEDNKLMGPQFKSLDGNCVINELKKQVDAKLHKKLDNYPTPNGIDINKDLKELSRILKVNIKYSDIDKNLCADHKTKSTHKKTIHLYGSNNHCFGIDPPQFPNKRTATNYPPHIMIKMINAEEQAINKAKKRLKAHKVTFNQYGAALMPEIERIQCEFIKELNNNLVYWLFGFNLIASDGTLYIYQDNFIQTTKCTHEQECEFEKITVQVSATETATKLVCRFEEEVCEPLLNSIYRDLYHKEPEEDLRNVYFSESALIFKYFIESNGIMPLTNYVDEFKCGNFEVLAVPYINNKEGDKKHIDIVTSYLAVQESTPHTQAIDYIKKYKYITGDVIQIKADINEIFNNGFNGVAHINKYEILNTTPKPIKFLLASHFAANEYIAIPLLDYIRKFITFECDHVIIGLDKITMKLPNVSKHYNRVIIGKLTEHLTNKMICSDQYEARTRLQNNTAFDYHKCGDMIILEQTRETKKYHHIRGSILAYAAINLFMGIEKFGDGDNIVKVLTDGIIYVGETPKSLNLGHNPGQFRDKPALSYRANNSVMPKLKGEYNKIESPELPDIRFAKRLLYCEGAGGTGKSYEAIKNASIIYGKENVIMAVPSHELKNNFLKTYDVACNTWQAIVGLSYDASKWTPENAKYSTHRKRCVIIDEVFTMGDLNDIMKYTNALLAAGSNVILLGDPYQLNHIGGDKNANIETAEYLRTLPFIEFTEDHRAKCPKLKQLKNEIRGKSDTEQINKIKEYAKNIDINGLLDSWRPGSIVLCTTHEMKNYINGKLLELHKKKFRDEPITLIVKKTEKLNYVFKKHKIKLYANNSLTLSLSEFEDFKDFDKFILGYTRTIHSVQGITAESNLYLIYDRLDAAFAKNSAYVAISRCKYLDQLHFVSAYVKETDVSFTVENIKRRINYIKNQNMPAFTLLEFVKLCEDGKFVDHITGKPITGNFAIQQIDPSKKSYDINNIKFLTKN